MGGKGVKKNYSKKREMVTADVQTKSAYNHIEVCKKAALIGQSLAELQSYRGQDHFVN